MNNKEIQAQRTRLNDAWQSYCSAARHLQELNTRVRYVKNIRQEWLDKFYAPAEERYLLAVQRIIDEAMTDA